MSKFDIIIIGSGPAGYVAAIRAAQLGKKVAIIEKWKTLGGTCLNVGCIPSKALLNSSEKYHLATSELAAHGVKVGSVKLDLKTMIGRKDNVVTQLTQGINYLMKKNKITVINGWATLNGGKKVLVDGKNEFEGENIIIASGSKPVELPFAKFDGKVVVDSTDALAFTKVPKEMIVIGAGVIGLELGSVWSRLGAKVTIIDIEDRPVAIMDKDLGNEAAKIFEAQGLHFELGTKVEKVDVKGAKAKVTIVKSDGKKQVLTGDKVLVAVGRKANTALLELEKSGVKVNERGVIETGVDYKTSADGIYAIGDCIKGPMLAHKGEEEGVACVEKLAGLAGHVSYDCMPWVVYTEPEISGVGLSEQDARDAGHEVKIGKFSFKANGRALAMNEPEGFVKIIADSKTDKVLGVHIIGHDAAEMIAEAVTAMEFSASSEDIARTVHAHPTFSEIIKEAALDVDKRALHT